MQDMMRYVVRKLGPHYDRSNVGMKLLLAPAIGALAMGLITWDGGAAPRYIIGLSIAGAVMGLVAAVFLAHEDARRSRPYEPRKVPLTNLQMAIKFALYAFGVLIAMFVGLPILLKIYSAIAPK
jgi:hypothetical protein